MPQDPNQKPERNEKPVVEKSVDEKTLDRNSEKPSYDSLIEDQKGAQTARDNDHFQADSSLSSET